MELPSCLLSPKEKLSVTKRNRAGLIRSELSSLHHERVDLGLQRKLVKEKQLKDLLSLEEEIRVLHKNRRKRFIIPPQFKREYRGGYKGEYLSGCRGDYKGEYSEEYSAEPARLQLLELEEDVRLQLEEGLSKLHAWSPRPTDLAVTEATSSTAVSKSLSPSDRKSTSLATGSPALASPKLSQIPELVRLREGHEGRRRSGPGLVERWNTIASKGTKSSGTEARLRPTLSSTKGESLRKGRKSPILDETVVDTRSFDDQDDGHPPATPCNTIDFPLIGTSLSPSTRANRRKTYWTQRVKHDFSPLVESGKSKALTDIRKAPKPQRKVFQLVKLVEIAKK